MSMNKPRAVFAGITIAGEVFHLHENAIKPSYFKIKRV